MLITSKCTKSIIQDDGKYIELSNFLHSYFFFFYLLALTILQNQGSLPCKLIMLQLCLRPQPQVLFLRRQLQQVDVLQGRVEGCRFERLGQDEWSRFL